MNELKVYLSELKAKLGHTEQADYFAEMSDNNYYTSGRHAATEREIRWLRSEIVMTEKLIALSE